jgi:hypothetical protein
VEESSCWYIVSRSGGVLVVKNSRCIVPLAYASMTTGVVNIMVRCPVELGMER